MLFQALRRALDDGWDCEYIRHYTFGSLVRDAFTDASPQNYMRNYEGHIISPSKYLSRLATVGALIIDDIGKTPSTERADGELFNLVEERTARRRPILWSANCNSEYLATKFGPDRGESLVRRLAEFSTVVNLL